MKKLLFFIMLCCSSTIVLSQTATIELYDFIQILITDSTGYSNVGTWDVGKTKKLPIKWKTERIEMSDDTSINFFRSGTVHLTLNGKSFSQAGKPLTWQIMLKGPRMGYTNFSIISSPNSSFQPKYTLDSVFGKKPFSAKLLKSCDGKTLSGYYYYQLKLPKKDVAFIKLSWMSINGNTAIRVDCFDDWSKYAVKLACPK